MRRTIVAFALLLSLAPAQAAELNVLTVGLVGSGFRQAAAAWSQKTGHTVRLVVPPSPLGRVLEAMKTENADAVLLPMDDLGRQGGQFRSGSIRPIGRVLFGLGGKIDGPSPRITSEAEFQAALAGKTVLITDPAVSLNGRMAQAVLARLGYESVRVQPIANSASRLARSDADYVLTVLPEELEVSSLKVVGEVPASLGLKIDFGGGVLTKAANPELAQQFLGFLVSPEAQAIWKAGGVASPVPVN